MKSIESLADYLLSSIFNNYCHNGHGNERVSDPYLSEKGLEITGIHIDHIESMIGDGKYHQDDNIEGDDNDCLGSFKNFCSPAVITLNVNNLSNFIKYLIQNGILRKIDFYDGIIPCNSLKSLVWLSILKTYIHECVHYYIAIENKKNKSTLSISKVEEEAVAVSFSYHVIENYTLYEKYITNTINYKLNKFSQKTLFRNSIIKTNLLEEFIPIFLNEAYQYSEPGYRDYIRVHDISELIKIFIINKNSEYQFLHTNSVKVIELIKIGFLNQLSLSKDILRFI